MCLPIEWFIGISNLASLYYPLFEIFIILVTILPFGLDLCDHNVCVVLVILVKFTYLPLIFKHFTFECTERFKVLSYNILADYLAQAHQFLYERIPSFMLEWKWRKDKLVFEFGLWSPDILCLQVVHKKSAILYFS